MRKGSYAASVMLLAESMARRPDPALAEMAAQMSMHAAAVYLAARHGPRVAAMHLYRLADEFAVMPDKRVRRRRRP